MNLEPSAILSAVLSFALGGCGSVDDSRGMVTDIRVVINELVPKNESIQTDAAGSTLDWVELYNQSTEGASLQGFHVSDDLSEPLRFELPREAVIEGKGYLVLYADGIGAAPLHLPFGLGSSGESFVLSDPRGRVLDSVTFGAAATDQAMARFPDGTGGLAWCTTSTLGASNGPSCMPAAK